MNSFFLFDAARATEENLLKASALNENLISLYRGRSEESLAAVAPYVFTFPHSNEFSDFILERGWGNSWGIFVYGSQNIEEIHHHFRKFLMVKTEDEKQFYFRFYDPRVLRIFLPTCDIQQLKEFFGPVQKFICEDEDPLFALVFSFNGKALVTEKMSADKVFPATKAPTSTEILQVANNDVARTKNDTGESKPRRRFFFGND
jgi:hypothetical protein